MRNKILVQVPAIVRRILGNDSILQGSQSRPTTERIDIDLCDDVVFKPTAQSSTYELYTSVDIHDIVKNAFE